MPTDPKYKALRAALQNGSCTDRMLTHQSLRYADHYGNTIAHLLARTVRLDTIPQHLLTPGLLRVANRRGLTVAHEIASSGQLSRIPAKLVTSDLLRLRMKDGYPVAHAALSGGINQIPSHLITVDLLRLPISPGAKSDTFKHRAEIGPRDQLKDLLGRMLVERAPELAPVVKEIMRDWRAEQIQEYRRRHPELCPETTGSM